MNTKTLILYITFVFLIYQFISSRKAENFVEFNSFDVTKTDTWTIRQNNFTQLIKKVNMLTLNISLNDKSDLLLIFVDILNSVGLGLFQIVSIGNPKKFTLFDVVLQEVESFSVIKLNRVDFNVNGQTLTSIFITQDETVFSTSFLTPVEPLKQDYLFRIKNPLHLLNTYNTSDNDNIISDFDVKLLKDVSVEKELSYKSFY